MDSSNFQTTKSNSIYKRSPRPLFLFILHIKYERTRERFLPAVLLFQSTGSSRQSRSAENTKHKEESGLEKQIKPHRNLFTPTIAQKNKHLTATALLPKAKYYRTYLEPYLNDIVYIECTKWTIKPDFVDGRPGDRILLLDAILVSVKHQKIQRTIPISHIWTVVDSEWKHRVHVNSAGKLYLKGFLYLYGHNGVKNIGFHTLYAKALRS